MRGEIIKLVFSDGTRFTWDTVKMRDGLKVLKIQKEKGDPIEVIGDGKAAQRLRMRYDMYFKDKANYRSDVIGGVQELTGSPRDAIEKKWNELEDKNKIIRKIDEALNLKDKDGGGV